MPLHGETVARACLTKVRTADQLCRKELDLFKAVIGQGGDVTVGCTQEAPLFQETAEEMGFAGRLTFANVREQAGWSSESKAAGPKTAALLAAAAVDMPPIHLVTLESDGVALVYGRDDLALEVGRRLADALDITVLLTKPSAIMPPAVTDFPVVKGTITSAKGHLGAFELAIDDYALASPASRRNLVWQVPRNGASSSSDIVIDLTGGQPLFPSPELRPGYLRVDPGDPAAIERLIGEARALVGTFDKPRYITFHEESLRPFALEDHRLHPLPRSLPDRRDHAEWRSCGDRPGRLRRLRRLCRCLPDGRCELCAAACRSRSGDGCARSSPRSGPPVVSGRWCLSMTRTMAAADRCPGAVR